jgi:hypothetical protein
MSQGPGANVVTTAANAVWYTDRCEIVTGATPVTYQVYATALRDQSAQGNIYSNPSSIDANSADTIYVGVGNYLTITGSDFTAQEIGGQTSAQAGVGGYGIDNIGPPPTPPVSAPTISNVNPSTGLYTGNTNITITGTNFISVTGVTIATVSATNINTVSSTQITATTPAGSLGSANLLVTAAGGNATTTFTYTAPAPTITGIAPASGPNTGFTQLSIVGTNFISVTGVTVGGTDAANVTANSSTLVTATAPAGVLGNAIIQVSALGGVANIANAYTYQPTTPPELNTGSFGLGNFAITPGEPYPSTADVTAGWTLNFGSNNRPAELTVLTVRRFPQNPSPTTQLEIQVGGGILQNGVEYTFTPPLDPPFPVTPYYNVQPGSQGGPGTVFVFFDLTQANNTYPTLANVTTNWNVYDPSNVTSAIGTVVSSSTSGDNVSVRCNFPASTAAAFSMRFSPP